MSCDKIDAGIVADPSVDQFVMRAADVLVIQYPDRCQPLDGRFSENARVDFLKLFKKLVFRFQPCGLTPIVEHVILKRQQVCLRIGKDDDRHYFRL